MTELTVITKKNDYWIRIPKSVLKREAPEIKSEKISARGYEIMLDERRSQKGIKRKGYKAIIEKNKILLEQLADS